MKPPFTTAQFFEVFKAYNTGVYPAQILLLALGIGIAAILSRKGEKSGKLAGVLLGILWLWTGIAYHFGYFTSINKAAYGFGGLFVLQGLFFMIESFRNNLSFEFRKSVRDYIGYFFILFGLFIYPAIGFLTEGEYALVISLGLPCPTVIFTFGIVLLACRKISRYLLIIPVVWAVIGTGAAINFGVSQDYMLIVAAVTALIFRLRSSKYRN